MDAKKHLTKTAKIWRLKIVSWLWIELWNWNKTVKKSDYVEKGNKKGPFFGPVLWYVGDYTTTGCISLSRLPLQFGKQTSCLFSMGVVVLVSRKTTTGIIEFLVCMMRI